MDADAENSRGRRAFLGALSVVAMVALYTLISNAYRLLDPASLPDPLTQLLRPEILPPIQRLLEAFVRLLGALPVSETPSHAGDDLAGLAQQNVTLQGSLLVSAFRVLAGLGVGAPLGILAGCAMGWSRRVDEYVHPIYVLLRSIPPLALIAYLMLWVGHGELHLLIPIAYAVFSTVVIPTYHGVRDLADVYVRAAQALGARGWLLFSKVVLPAAGPSVLAAMRYSLVIAWMTAVGAEMLMGESGMGRLLVGGGIWSARLRVRVDPAVVMVGILTLAAAGYAMDTAARIIADRLTRWVKR
jgi:ABC-type nitrate/sulfonate/bicarbonate transport system permease component